MGDVWGSALVDVPHAGRYENVFTGEVLEVSGSVRLAELFRDLPLALLVRRAR
jgi:maltooligosyltrehalose synthase